MQTFAATPTPTPVDIVIDSDGKVCGFNLGYRLINNAGILIVDDVKKINSVQSVKNKIDLIPGSNIKITPIPTPGQIEINAYTNYVELVEIAGDPSEPPAGTSLLYLKSSGGKTTLCIRFNNGGGPVDVTEIAQEN